MRQFEEQPVPAALLGACSGRRPGGHVFLSQRKNPAVPQEFRKKLKKTERRVRELTMS